MCRSERISDRKFSSATVNNYRTSGDRKIHFAKVGIFQTFKLSTSIKFIELLSRNSVVTKISQEKSAPRETPPNGMMGLEKAERKISAFVLIYQGPINIQSQSITKGVVRDV